VNYYGRFHRSALHAVFDTLDFYLARWMRRKYRNMKEKTTRARQVIGRIRGCNPALFVHWNLSNSGGQ
jgi:RNA-directed DNA polymerase